MKSHRLPDYNENMPCLKLITKTKTPKFDLKLGGKNWTEDNLTDQTYFDYNLTSYVDGVDFRWSYSW